VAGVRRSVLRRGRIDDFPQFWTLGERLLAATPYAGIEIDRQLVARTFGQCCSTQVTCCYVTLADGVLNGAILGVASPVWWHAKRSASDLFFHAERPGDGRRLLRAFVAWAWSVPSVVDITMAESSAMDPVRGWRLYERQGFTVAGGCYVMRRPT